MKKYIPIFLILFSSLIFYLPILINSDLMLARGNDLQQQFWPVFFYTRENFLKFHQIPLWNNLFFSGTPLLPDPQFSPIYPGNILFLLLPTNQAFFTFYLLHSIFAGITSYILAKHGLRFSTKASIFLSLLYISTPKLAGYLEAGHYGLFAAHAWIPLAIFAICKLTNETKIKYAILLGISFSGLYFTHTVIFLLAIPSSIALLIFLILFNKKENTTTKIILFFVAFLITIGLCAATLLPELSWIPQTTRNLLSIHPDVYPKWISLNEFFSNFFTITHSNISNIDEEKWITVGNFTFAFALCGFVYLLKKIKVLVAIVLALSFIFMINNLSPFYGTLLFTNWYQLTRVTTRLWFISGTILIILAALGFEKLSKQIKKPYKVLILGFAILAILENLSTSELRITQKHSLKDTFVQSDLLNFLKKDKDQFRIFCTTRCVSQQEAALNNLELVEGYNTLQQMNYYKITKIMMGGSWDYYTLPIPPSGIGELTPDPSLLGEYNVKYVISPYKLTNTNFAFLNIYNGNFYLYKNSFYQPRSNQKIVFYSPNFVKIEITNSNSNLILRDVYSPGWNAFTNKNEKLRINETQSAEREMDLPKNTKFVSLFYEPQSFKTGLIITTITLILLSIYSFFNIFKQKKNNSKN